jgi:hypothetical protein
MLTFNARSSQTHDTAWQGEAVMQRKILWPVLICWALCIFTPAVSKPQSANAFLRGTVSDPSAATVAGAELTLTSQETGAMASFTTDARGEYMFGNLPPGTYDLKVAAQGFQTYMQQGIKLHLGDNLRQDVSLKLGTQQDRVEVVANASLLDYDNGEHKEGVPPEIIAELPLEVSGSIRSAGNFISLLPGVSPTGWTARINGSQENSGTSVLDGATLYNPVGYNGIIDDNGSFPQSPDDISEISALTSNYSPQYGGTQGGVLLMNIRSGSEKFHGSAYEFNRNTDLNARQFGVAERPKDIENEFGFRIGGPVKIPLLWSGRNKTFFFFNLEEFRQAGSLTQQTMTIPSLKERQGDFSDWVDSNGNLIPVYDPATTRTNPNYNPNMPEGPSNLPYLRDQFMGCDGHTPNVICPSDPRLQNSLASEWFKFLPNPTSSGAINNYLAPPMPNGAYPENAYTLKLDEYIGDKNHISFSANFKYVLPTNYSSLPDPISNSLVVWNRFLIWRVNYDRTITQTLLNHLVLGYNNAGAWWGGIDAHYGDQLPQIPGVATHAFPPSISFGSDFPQLGTSAGTANNPAPLVIGNDTMTWVKGRHTFNFGGEYRNAGNNLRNVVGGESGMFSFSNTETGLLDLPNSGNPIASFLLEQVDSGSAVFKSIGNTYTRWHQAGIFFGDDWKATQKLTVNYGIRWEQDLPTFERSNNFSFLDPTLPNPGADNRPGALAFAGYGSGRCNCRYPEIPWHKGFAPRIGLAYSLPRDTVIRAGYGIFYDMYNMPGWGTSGISQDGYTTTPTFSSTNGGMDAAFILSQGLPGGWQMPPFIDPSFDNGGTGPIYRPVDANRLPYAQQFNLTIDHEFTKNFYVSAAYVGSKGTRLPSMLAGINTADPKYLAMGSQLYDQFSPGQTQVDGVPVPFTNFAANTFACAPNVAQALVPYPQYCNDFYGLDENKGSSSYNSFQLKAEHRFGNDLWFLGSYTLSKTITDADNTQPGSGSGGIFSPYQSYRYRSLARGDVPQTIVASLVYGLPFGNGKNWLSGKGFLSKVVSNWTVSQVFSANSGLPFSIWSSVCNIPQQFSESCVPGLLPGMSPFAQPEHGHGLDPNKPLLNVNAFESANSFNFYQGNGPRTTNFRQPGAWNQDIALSKKIPLGEKVSFTLRGEFFNAWNLHNFSGGAFVTDVASPGFGSWNGNVSGPRSIQVAGRITF